MARLSIDIGVNLGDSTKQLGKLNSALIELNKNANTLVSSLKAIGGVNVNPKVTTQVAQQTSQAVAPVVNQPNLTPVPDIFADFNSGAIQASTALEFLEKKQAELITETARLKTALGTAVNPGAYQQLQGELNKTEKELNDVTKAIQAQKGPIGGATNAYGNLTKSTNLANLSLVNVGRVFQDLPFGILGIANNLNPLIEGLRDLSVQAKASGSSIGKELLNSLKGFGGVTLAISAVSAALSFASVGLSYWTRESKKAKDENDKFRESLDKAKASALSTGVQLQGLLNIAKNSTLPLEQQKLATDKLNEELERYGIKLSNTAIKSGEAQKAIDNLTASLVQQSIASAQAEELGKRFVEQANLTKTLTQRQNEYKAALSAVERLSGRTLGAREQETLNIYIERLSQTRVALNEATNAINANKKGISDLQIDYDNAAKSANAYLLAAGGKSKTQQKQEKTKKNLKDEKTDAEKYAEALQKLQDSIDAVDIQPFLTDAEKVSKKADILKNGLQNLASEFPKLFNPKSTKIKEFYAQFEKLNLTDFGNKIKNIAEDANTRLESIKLQGDILDEDKIKQSIGVVNGVINKLKESQVDLNKIPKTDVGYSIYADDLALINSLLSIFSENLRLLNEAQKKVELGNVFKKYKEDIQRSNRDFKNAKLFKDVFNTDILKEEIKKTEKELNTGISAFNDALEKTGGRPNVLALFLSGEIDALEEQLERLKETAIIEENLQALDKNIQNIIRDTFGNIFESLGDVLAGESAGKAFAGVFASLTESLGRALIDFAKQSLKVATVIDAIKKAFTVGGKVPFIAIAGAAALGALLIASSKLVMKGFASGGFVSGPGSDRSDSIPARLSNGEFVVNAKSVRKYGRGFMEMLNNGSMPITNYRRNFGDLRFADGGFVEGLRQFARDGGSSKALVNRSGEMTGIIAETKISGQDLRLVLKRADRRFSNTTSSKSTGRNGESAKALVN